MLKLSFSLASVAEKSFTGIDTRPNEICADANARGIKRILSVADAQEFVQWLLRHTKESMPWCGAFPAAEWRRTARSPSWPDWRDTRGKWATRCTRCPSAATCRGTG